MKRIPLLAFLAILLFCSTISSAQNKKYRIEGIIDGSFDGQRAILTLHDDYRNITRADTSIINQGKFWFEGDEYLENISSINIEDRYGIKTLEIGLDLLLESGIISITCKDNRLIMQGTPLNNLYMALQDDIAYSNSKIKNLLPEWGSSMTFPRDSDYGKLYYLLGENIFNFIKQNYSNPLSKALLMQIAQIEAIPTTLYVLWNGKALEETFDFVDEEARATPRFISYLESFKRMKAVSPFVGKQVDDFTLAAVDVNTKQLSDYIGQKDYTLLEFWASWCGPCLAAIPELKEIYAEYSDKLEIVSISLDTNKTEWSTAMKKQNMPWPQLGDMNGLNSDISKAFDIKAIPFALLLDKQGVVIHQIGAASMLKMFMQNSAK